MHRGQVVAKLDDDEYVQAIILAKADIEVAKANLVEAKSALEIAGRKLKRFQLLRERRATSDSEFDLAQAGHLGKQARLEVSKAQLTRAEASLETAKIRIRYTKVTAGWTGGDDHRVVADRYVEKIVYAAVPETVPSMVMIGASGWRPDAASNGLIWLSLLPSSQRKRSNTSIAEDLRRRINPDYPGARFTHCFIRINPDYPGSHTSSWLIPLDSRVRGNDKNR